MLASRDSIRQRLASLLAAMLTSLANRIISSQQLVLASTLMLEEVPDQEVRLDDFVCSQTQTLVENVQTLKFNI